MSDFAFKDPLEGASFLVFLHRMNTCSKRMQWQVEEMREHISIPFKLMFVDEPEGLEVAKALGIFAVPVVLLTYKNKILRTHEGVIKTDLESWLDAAVNTVLKAARKIT